jgi:hypothetical protein
VKNILTVFCSVTAALWGGCNRPTSTHAVDSTLTVEQLLANPQGHAHVVVKVRGCFYHGFEMVVLHPCDVQKWTQRIWLDDAKGEQELTTINRLHPEYKLPPGTELLFQFDEARNSRAWKKLYDNIASDVVLVGQFETGSGFGHLGAYTHELILVDVLDNKSNPTP